jgi:gliding motility-associated-like protein
LKIKLKNCIFSIFFLFSCLVFGQNVSLYEQFNGTYNFTFLGNTMNVEENGANDQCLILTSSAAKLHLNLGDEVVKAYLYWAGSGTGDFDVKLNDTPITAERTFALTLASTQKPFFSAFADVTSLMSNDEDSGYELSEFDISSFLASDSYCNNGTNFAGWGILVVIRNSSLPNNQINIYDGLQNVPSVLNINLNSLNVIDNVGAKIGFIAWEGDRSLAVNETLTFNGNVISNPPLNPANNAFNGTNSITGSETMYNMDLDIYDIQNNIQVGDQNATINLTSGQDFVMINVVVTKLNNEAPDATIIATNYQTSCNSRNLLVDYTVRNFDSFNDLPSNTPIAFYANNVLVGQAFTQTILPIGGSVTGQITLTLPITVPNDFTLKLVVDDTGNGSGIINEILETNNTFSLPISLWVSPKFNSLTNLFSCVTSLTSVAFDFSGYANSVIVNVGDLVVFYNSLSDAENQVNPITNSSNFTVSTASTTIYVRIDNVHCYSITSFDIKLILYPSFNVPDDVSICRINATTTFDFTSYLTSVKVNATDTISFYETQVNADSNTNPILNYATYLPMSTPKEIFVRIDNGFCHSTTSFMIDFYELPKYNPLSTLLSCNEGLTKGTFDFMNYDDLVKVDPMDTVVFYETLEDAENETNAIITPSNYVAQTTPKEIFVRIENSNDCNSITSFLLTTKNCPPTVYNYVSANGDNSNPVFFVEGLRDIFLNFKIDIFNRWGKLVWTGNNTTDDWDGLSNQQIRTDNTTISPRDTYFYVIELNDPDYTNPLVGYLYLFRKNQ